METRSLAMTTSETHPLFRRILFLLLKAGLVVFLTMAAGWGYGYILLKANLFPGVVQKVVVVLMSASVAGILARFILHADGKFAAIFGALIAMLAGLTDLANLSAGRIGVRFVETGRPLTDGDAAWQLLLGAAVILLAIFAWYKPVAAPLTARKTVNKPSRKTTTRKTHTPAKSTRKFSRVWKPIPLKKLFKPVRSFYKSSLKKVAAVYSDMKSSSRSAARRIANAVPRKRPTQPTRLPAVKFHRANVPLQSSAFPTAASGVRRLPKSAHSPIRLVGREEHRCPYCLGVVSPGDPDGIVVCPVCKTYHHKGCWDVTGECQVPHIHE
jgi:hypothetical protein